MRDDGRVAVALGEGDGVEGLGQGTDLVYLHENRVGGTGIDTLLEEVYVGDEEIVADELHCVAEGVGEFLPGGPVVFGAAVLDGDDGVFGAEVLIVGDEFGAGEAALIGLFEDVGFLFLHVELGGGDVEGEEDVLAEFVAGSLDRFGDGVEGIGGGREVGGKAAFVTDGSLETLGFEHLFEGVEHFGAGAESFGEGVEVLRDDHELLEVDRSVGVRAAVHDVHQRNGEHLGVRAADVFVEGQAGGGSGGLGGGEGDAEDGVGTELGLGLRAIELDHGAVNAGLVEGVEAEERGCDLPLHVAHGLLNALAAVAGLVAIAELDGLVFPGGGTGRNRGTAEVAGGKFDVNFDRGIATGVDNFASGNGADGGIHERKGSGRTGH